MVLQPRLLLEPGEEAIWHHPVVGRRKHCRSRYRRKCTPTTAAGTGDIWFEMVQDDQGISVQASNRGGATPCALRCDRPTHPGGIFAAPCTSTRLSSSAR